MMLLKKHATLLFFILSIGFLTIGCRQNEVETAVPTPFPSATPAPALSLVTMTPAAAATAVPASPIPLPDPTQTPTAVPQDNAITISPAAEGCRDVDLNTAVWSPLTATFNGGSDPFFQIHTNEPGFFFNLELYTVFGPGWTGQTGTFPADCDGNGLCVYLAPNNVHSYLAVSGEVTINALAVNDGAIEGEVDIRLRDLMMEPLPGTGGEGCYVIADLPIRIAASESEMPETAVGYPILPDAANLIESAELVAYETAVPFAEVVAFYQAQMAAAGWELADEFQRPPRATLTFTQGDDLVQVNLNPGAGTDGVLVMIAPLP